MKEITIELDGAAGRFKERAVARYAGASVLDAGGRDGRLALHAVSLGKTAVLCDMNTGKAPALLPTVRGDVRALPFADKSFDTVLLFDVLEHVAEAEAGLAEACRVARRNVMLSLPRPDSSTTSASGLAFRHYRDPSHRRYYDEAAIRNLVDTTPAHAFGIRAFSRVRPARYYSDAGGPRLLARIADGILRALTRDKDKLLRNYFALLVLKETEAEQ